MADEVLENQSQAPESAENASHDLTEGISSTGDATITDEMQPVKQEAGNDAVVLTKEMLAEECKLEQQGEAAEDKMTENKHKEYERMTEKIKNERYENLCLLLSKSTLYTNYLIGRMERQKEDEQRRQQRKLKRLSKDGKEEKQDVDEVPDIEKSNASSSLKSPDSSQKSGDSSLKEEITNPKGARRSSRIQQTDSQSSSQGSRKSTRKRKAEETPSNSPQITDFFTSPRAKRQKTESNASTPSRSTGWSPTPAESVMARKVESGCPDPDDWERQDGARMFNGKPVSPEQPHLLTGGLLRQYQVEGFTWLCSLFENGINGILADEMGLGKTIQCIALVANLVWKGVPGPFLVCAPLSTVPNWVAEFKRFAPRVPVILYHGSIEGRDLLRNKIGKFNAVRKGIQVNPVVVTSYEIAMNDRKLLGTFEWKLMIIDEGHRIKNFQCRLIRELKMYRTTHRLLLTGTPLQNNLAELWSLLNFLLPEIFDDLGSFEMWFDLDLLQSSCVDDEIVQEEKKHNILAMLHQVLTPFMLRRLKADVDLDVPPKRELLVYAPLMERQQQIYLAVLDDSIRSLVNGVEKEDVVELTEHGRPVRKSRSKVEYGSLLDSEGEEDDQEVPGKQRSRVAAGKDDGDNDVETWAESVSKLSQKDSSACARLYKTETGPQEKQVTIQLRNKLSILKKACNHPYLIEYPLTPTGEYLIDEELVRCSGKMSLLDRVLTQLKEKNHKVLIFSQMTEVLDLLQDYCYLRDYKFCRLQGSTKMDERHEQITLFNEDKEQFVFLLSTRAGGLGINLTSADTVIIFDSDWNPQCDLQAQDRCHRIGQTRPVLILRLVAANTVDQQIVERAAAKRKLEKMVIHKGKFKVGMDHQQFDIKELELLNMDELRNMLKERDFDRVVDHRDRRVISDKDLNQLLDRGDLHDQWRKSKGEPAQKAGSMKPKPRETMKISEVAGVFKIIGEELDTDGPAQEQAVSDKHSLKQASDKENVDSNKLIC